MVLPGILGTETRDTFVPRTDSAQKERSGFTAPAGDFPPYRVWAAGTGGGDRRGITA